MQPLAMAAATACMCHRKRLRQPHASGSIECAQSKLA